MAKVSLQSLLDHTAQRICQSSEDVLLALPEDARSNLKLLSEMGCDGSGNQSSCKQTRVQGKSDDSALLMTCVVPLQLFAEQEMEENLSKKLIVWQNPPTSSKRYCRPMKFEFTKETLEAISLEREEMLQQINDLQKCLYTVEAGEEKFQVKIDHHFVGR